MNDRLEKTFEMRRYIDRSRVLRGGRRLFDTAELMTIKEFARDDILGAVLLALNYGYAKGRQEATAGVSK